MYFLFKSNKSFVLIIAILTCLLLFNTSNATSAIYMLNGNMNWLITIFTNVLIVTNCVLFNISLEKNNLISKPSHVPIITYMLVLVGAFYICKIDFQVILSLAITQFAYHLLNSAEIAKPSIGQYFNVGCLLGIASLLFFPACILVAMPLMFISIYTKFSTKYYLNTMLGFVLPFLIFWAVNYLLYFSFEWYLSFPEQKNPNSLRVAHLIGLIYIFIITMLGVIYTLKKFTNYSLSSKKALGVSVIAAIAIFVSFMLFKQYKLILFVSPLLALAISKYVVESKNSWVSEAVLSGLLISIILSQF